MFLLRAFVTIYLHPQCKWPSYSQTRVTENRTCPLHPQGNIITPPVLHRKPGSVPRSWLMWACALQPTQGEGCPVAPPPLPLPHSILVLCSFTAAVSYVNILADVLNLSLLKIWYRSNHKNSKTLLRISEYPWQNECDLSLVYGLPEITLLVNRILPLVEALPGCNGELACDARLSSWHL